MAQPGIITLENCTPMNDVSIFTAAPGQPVTRAWSFAVNGEATVQGYENDSLISGSSIIDPRAVAMGFDGELSIQSGSLAGTVLAHEIQWEVRFSIDTVVIQPLNQLRRTRRIVSTELVLTLSEYVVNDSILLAQVVAPLLGLSAFTTDGAVTSDSSPISDPVLSFQGQIATVTLA